MGIVAGLGEHLAPMECSNKIPIGDRGGFEACEAEYHLCCGGGQIYMSPTPDPPAFIQQLFKNNQFMKHIRAYNQMFAMTSFGAKSDHSVNKGRGPYVFKISGQIYHWIGSLCMEEGHHPHFLQLYVYDTHDELSNRMHHFGGLDESTLNPEIVKGLIHVLDEHNGLVRLFITTCDICNVGDIPSFRIRLYNMGGIRGYELPTADVLGAIVFENRPRSCTDFDVIIKFKGGPPQRINKLHQSYMSLQFPLLFIFGQPGFYPELTLKPRDGRGKGKSSVDVLSALFTAGYARSDWSRPDLEDCSVYRNIAAQGVRRGSSSVLRINPHNCGVIVPPLRKIATVNRTSGSLDIRRISSFALTSSCAEAEFNVVVQVTRRVHLARFHFIKEHVENGVIELYFVTRYFNWATSSLKLLAVKELKFLINKLGIANFTPGYYEKIGEMKLMNSV
ncbi:hypothetical protein Tco_1164013, partial [Tanacetum coccineum]